MGLGNLCFLRSAASRLACSIRSISTVVNRPSQLVQKPYCPVRLVVSYSTATINHHDHDWISSEKAVIREIDAEYNAPAMEVNDKNVLESFLMCMWKDRSIGMRTPPEGFPFKMEDIPGSRTFTLTRDYNGEHIKVVVTMPILHGDDDEPNDDESNDDDDAPSTPSNESNDGDDDAPPPTLSNESIPHVEHAQGILTLTVRIPQAQDDDAPSNESIPYVEHTQTILTRRIPQDDDDAPSNESNDDETDIPLVVTVTKKSGRSLELRCSCNSDKISIDDIHVHLPGNSSEGPKLIQDMDDFVGMDHTSLKEALNKYLKVRGLDASTIQTISGYMLNKMKLEYWLWLDSVKEFLEE